MNYIGSKYKLSDFIKASIVDIVGDTKEKIFAEIFGGTGIVARKFKPEVKKVIANDFEPFSYALLRNYIGNHQEFEYQQFLEALQNIEPKEGFIYQNYCLGSGSERQYFSDENGKKIDAMRQQLAQWKLSREINENQYDFLLASLMESADKVANTASVYGAFLKHLKASAQKPLDLKPAFFPITQNSHQVFKEDANILIKEIEGDILYLDPPYNARQYGANYHLLNTIALYDNFVPRGKTGLRQYIRSEYCQKGKVREAFKDLIQKAKFRYIFLSYNNEGLMSHEDIRNIMGKYGRYSLISRSYQRFKADKTENRKHKANATVEYLHVLEKINS